MASRQKRTIGLIGGMSPASTLEYYRELNRLAAETLGASHSARLVLYSLDFGRMRQLQQSGDREGQIEALLQAAAGLERAGADLILICSNTKHEFAQEVERAVRVPLVHIVDALGEALAAAGAKTPLLLGTRATMSSGFYTAHLQENHGLAALVPGEGQQKMLDKVIFNELVRGVVSAPTRQRCVEALAPLVGGGGADSVILGCTELGLLLRQEDLSVPLFDTTLIHAGQAFRMAME